MEKQEFKNAMQLLDRSIDLVLAGEYENVKSIVEVTEKLIVDDRYPRKWFNYYTQYTFEKLHKRLVKKYSYCHTNLFTDAGLNFMQGRKHELQGERDYIHHYSSANGNLEYASKEEAEAIRRMFKALGELAYKYKKVITLA